MTTRNRELASIIDDSGNITAGGNLTVSGTTTTVSSTVETHADPLIELNTGAGSNANDLGFVFERGSTGDNACLIWDESNDGFVVGTTSATGTSTGNMSFTAGDFAAGKITVDSVLINGTTIGHTSDPDLLTIADGLVTVAGEISVTTLDIGGTNVSSTAAELNILDGVNSTAAELNILDGVTATAAEINFLDGDTSATGTTLASADRVIVNDGGTMKQVALSDFETFFESEIDTFSTIDINGGSIDGATVGANSASSGAFTTLTVDDINLNGKVVTMTGSTDDTAVLTVGTNGTLSIVTVDTAAAAANIQITADGTVDIDSAGVLTLDSGAAINIEPAAGSAILLDGTISIDGGVITNASSITSTAFVGTLSTAAQTNITSLGTLTGLDVNGAVTINDNLSLDGSNKELRFYEGANYVGFEAPALSANQIWVLPTVDGDANQTLKTDGSGTLSWATAASAVSNLTDVTISSLASNDYLRYSGSAWVNVAQASNPVIDTMTGDGSDTTLTLTQAPLHENATLVTISGVVQHKSTYSISGTTLTFSTAPPDGSAVECITNVNTNVMSGNDVAVDTMTGDNSDTTLSLSVTPSNENHVNIYFNGVYQEKSGWSLSGTTVTFSTAPPTGVTVEAVSNQMLAVGTATALSASVISGSTLVTAVGADHLLVYDATDGALKKALVSDVIEQATTEEVQDIAGAMFTGNTETGITATYQDGDGTIDLVVGTLNQNTTGSAATLTTPRTIGGVSFDGSANIAVTLAATATALANARTIGGTSFDGTGNIAVALATLATTATVTDSTANTNFPVVFHNESNGLLDDTGALRYNPSTGQLLVPNLTVAGTTTTVDTVTMNAQNAVIFEGATADNYETTLSIVDPTADHTQYLINQGGYIPVLAASTTTAITSTPAELNILDGATVVVGEINALDLGSTAVGTAIASKAVILDSNKDYTGLRNLTITGELDAATLDISGAIDVAGTANLDVVDIDGAVDMASTLAVAGVLTGASLDISGDVDVDGTLETDALTINGSALNYKAFGTSSFMLGDTTTGTISAANQNVGVGIDVFEDLTTGDDNTAIGTYSMKEMVSGSQNVAVGLYALQKDTDASFNTAIGYEAMSAATNPGASNTAVGAYSLGVGLLTGANNVAIGKDALKVNTTGTQNTAVGYLAGDAVTTGSYNALIGANAGGALTTGAQNVSVGQGSLATQTTVTGNTAIGDSSLAANTTGDDNTAVGFSTLNANTTGTDNTALGDNALLVNTTSSNNTAVGSQALAVQTTGGGYNVAIGLSTLGANTTGEVQVAVGANALLTNTTGTQNTAIGGNSLYANTEGDNNVAVGHNALDANTTANRNTAVGKSAMTDSTTGAENVAMGYEALGNNTTGNRNTALGDASLNTATTASDNTAVGQQAMLSTTTGANNTAVGQKALYANTTASHNTAVGYTALTANTDGYANTAVGSLAGDALTTGDFNVFIGKDAGGGTTTADANTAVGESAFVANSTGHSNVAMGANALGSNTTGIQNTAVGRSALYANTSANQSTAFGNNALGACYGALNSALGSHALASVTNSSYNVGIGYNAGGAINTGEKNTCIGATAGDAITDYHNNICIGYGTDPGNTTGHSIVIGHDIVIDGNWFVFGKASNYVYNGFTSNASWTRNSDERLKKNIATNTLGLSFINDLRPVTFNWKASTEIDSSDSELAKHYDASENHMDSTTTFHGFVAQEVKTAMDNAGVTNFGGWNKLSSGIQGTSLEAMVTPLVKAIQELSAKNDVLEARIETLEG